MSFEPNDMPYEDEDGVIQHPGMTPDEPPEQPNAFERRMTITPAFDKRDKDPSKNYGIGSCRLRMVLIGPLGATHFTAQTGWYLPQNMTSVLESELAFREASGLPLSLPLLGIDVGYHAAHPQYDGQQSGECDLLPAGRCYGSGSALRADEWANILVAEGSERIWAMLEDEYHAILGERGEVAL